MPEVGSAGTIIGAVLETAGYVAQSHILQDFGEFFQGAGALFYTAAAIGGIISVALFGSYRMAQYLLLGPAIFWWLVGSTTTTQPVQYRLGGGEPLDVSPAFVGPLEGYLPQGEIKVSTFFKWYTTLINDLTREIADAILQHENDEDLLFLARNQVLDLVVHARPQKEQLFNMLKESLFGACQPMMSTAIALSSYNLSPQHEAVLTRQSQMGNQEAAKALQRLQQERARLQGNFNDYHEMMWVSPGPELREFVRMETQSFVDGTGGKNYAAAIPQYSGHTPQQFLEEDLPKLSLTCGDVWMINRDRIEKESAWFLEQVYDGHITGPLARDPVEARRLLCEAIGAKLHRDYAAGGSGPCDLTEVASTYMLRRLISDHSLYGQVAQQAKGRMGFVGGKRGYIFLDEQEGENGGTMFDDRRIRVDLGDRLKIDIQQDANGVDSLVVWDDKTQSWRPFDSVEAPGMMDIAYTDQQRYQSRGLMQGIFTYALSLPYWQGTILYFLSVAYPFLTVLVLLPGRAGAFMYMPLFWLWAKSWDVGFALVMVLDKILWNLLPSTDLPYNPLSANDDQTQLPDVLQLALGVDPSYDIHAHYNFIAMALFAVPGITGYAILKAKASVLSSFTDGPQAAADDAKNLGEGKTGLGLMNSRLRDQFIAGGAGIQSIGMRGESILADGRGVKAGALAGTNTVMQALQGFSRSDRNGLAYLKTVVEGAGNGVQSFSDLLAAEATHSVVRRFAFDDVWGRYGQVQRMLEASASAVDGGGGFEINANEVAKDVNKALLELWKARIKVASEISDAGLNMIASRLLPKGAGGGLIGLAPSGVAMGYAGYNKYNPGVGDLQDTDANVVNEIYRTDFTGVYHGPHGDASDNVRTRGSTDYRAAAIQYFMADSNGPGLAQIPEDDPAHSRKKSTRIASKDFLYEEREFDDVKGGMFTLPATEKRPNVIYMEDKLFRAFLTDRAVRTGTEREQAEEQARRTGGFFAPSANLIVIPIDKISNENGRWVGTHSGSRAEVMQWGATLAHEYKHYQGGSEYQAWKRTQDYLNGAGFKLNQHDDDDVLLTIYQRYSDRDFAEAVRERFGGFNAEAEDWLRRKLSLSPYAIEQLKEEE